MPVDLSSLPPKARQPSFPSIKRWGLFFVFLFLMIQLLHSFLTSQSSIQQIPQINLLIFSVLFSLVLYLFRYMAFLLVQRAADGWNAQRAIDEEERILIGQRKITILAQAMFLPHIINCRDLPTQIISAKTPLLVPNIINSEVNYCAQFIDKNESDIQRVINHIESLLNDPSMLTAIRHTQSHVSLTVIISIGENINLSITDRNMINNKIESLIERSFNVNYEKQSSFHLIDNWLDKLDTFELLLMINLSLLSSPNQRYSEVSIAQLLSSPKHLPSLHIAYLHRPESVSSITDDILNMSIKNALLWGNITLPQIESAWLNAFSVNNEEKVRTAILSTENGNSLSLYSIDNILGCTQHASPWLNLYIATSYLMRTQNPQLSITHHDKETFIWAITP